MLQHVLHSNSIYYSADLREVPLQINALAVQIEQVIPLHDKKALLIGETKWSDNNQLNEVIESLSLKEQNIPFTKPPKIIKALFQKVPASHPDIFVFAPDEIISHSI